MNAYRLRGSCAGQQALTLCHRTRTEALERTLLGRGSSQYPKGTGCFRLCKCFSRSRTRLKAVEKESQKGGEEVLSVRDVMNESQFWRQEIARSLGELSGSGYESERESNAESLPSPAPSEKKIPSTKKSQADSNVQLDRDPPATRSSGSGGGLKADSEAHSRGDPQESKSVTAGQSPGPLGPPPQETQSSKQEASSTEPSKAVGKAPFKRREADPNKLLTPDSNPPRPPAPSRPRPKVVEPLSAKDWENMSKLLGMPVEELERNSVGSGLELEQGKLPGQGPPQPAQKTSKPVATPASIPQPKAAAAPVAVLSRKAAPSHPKRSSDLVERSELTKLRQTLNKKLSDANMYNRHLQREISDRDKAVRESTLHLGVLQTELKTLVEVAKEIAAGGTKPVTRKINGRYIQSHLAARLEDLCSQLDGQLRQVDTVRLREVPVTWLGMAEDVKIMGSFDGWTRGQHLSPETTGAYTLFSTVLQLRPGRYEVKFVVDGTWQLAPSWTVVGEGLSANNLLVVD